MGVDSSDDQHYRALENMYLGAPINEFFAPSVDIANGHATVEIDVTPKLFHAGRAIHGSVYFKMLDDAAFFAASSLEPEYFIVTASFQTYLLRPVTDGKLRAIGTIASQTKRQFIAEAVVFDAKDREVGRGNGIFMRTQSPWTEIPGYAV
ncbi:MAG: PaaI family thioesterase [Pseudomonadota bacterium]